MRDRRSLRNCGAFVFVFWLCHGTVQPSFLGPRKCYAQSETEQSETDKALGATVGPPEQTLAASDQIVDFSTQVQPILRKHCFECHASGNEEGGLNLAHQAGLLNGGDDGQVVVPGDSERSLLFQLIAGVDPERSMPPADHKPLAAEQIATLRAWIDQGAQWPADAAANDPAHELASPHWAYQPLLAGSRALTSEQIDACIVHELSSHGLSPSLAASPHALMRRLSMDLVGLPPTSRQLADWEHVAPEQLPAKVSESIDEYLASDHYGERWGRHWLDLVRYADSDGQESDSDRPQAWRYRDFVIHAFNDDMPFDQFVRWQIAGDEYEPDNPQAIVATGFLIGGTHSELEAQFLEEERLFNRYNELDDVISTLGTSLLGLTVGCARCHDHKYDQFSARNYYQLLSAFHSGDRATGPLPNGEPGFFFRDFDSDVRSTWLFRRSNFHDREITVELDFPEVLLSGRQSVDYLQSARQAVPTPHSTLQRRALAEWLTDVEHGSGALLARVMVNRVWQHHFGQGLVRTPSDFGVRGDPPTHPELLELLAADFVSHGWQLKRLQRLILNTAVWRQSSQRDAIDPAAYQAARTVDPDNRLLWKMIPQRLEAEVLRDCLLAASGSLNLQPYGPGFKPYIPPEANQARNLKDKYPNDVSDDASTRRRSVYMFHKRVVPYPLLQAFDRPDLLVSCARRQDTTVAPQALAMLNDPWVRSCASTLAERLLEQCGDDDQALIAQSFHWSLSRPPSDSELALGAAYLVGQTQTRAARDDGTAGSDTTDSHSAAVRQQAVTDYCQTLFALSEFLYVD